MSIIETRNLTKVYKRFEKEAGLLGSVKSLFHRQYTAKEAVAGLNLAIEEGEFVGLIGPNGAGKTTLIKMLTGIIPPTSGDLRVLGYEPNRLEDDFKRQYAMVMGQKSQLFFELSTADTLLLFKELYSIPDDIYTQNVRYFTQLFDVEKLMNVQVRTLSLGERMKMELIVALLHNPRVLFLDEPTIGLDAVAQRQMRGFLREVNQQRGTTIILTSHYMEDIVSLCPRCVVINHGHKLYDGPLETLFHRVQKYKRVTVTFAEAHDAAIPQAARVLERTPYKQVLLVERPRTQEALQAIIQAGDIADLSIEEEDIGVVVERIYAAEEGALA